MSNKKYNEFSPGTGPTGSKVLLIADATTGQLEKVTLSALATFFGGSSGSGDTTAPTIVSITATAATSVVVVFSENVNVTTAGWSFKKNGSAWSVSSVAGSGTTWTFTMGTSAISSDTLLGTYDATSGATVDSSSNELASFTDTSVTNSIGSSYDSDADAFFTATGITDTTQKNAVNQLVLDFKAASVWTKMVAVYPFVGGTATTHKYNLKNPLDTDGAYRITFNGTITHSSNGIAGGGTIADYGNTHIIPSSVFTGNSGAFGVYLRSAGSGTVTYLGVIGASSSVAMSNASGTLYGTLGETTSGTAPYSANPAAYTRTIILSRTGSLAADNDGYRDGTAFGNGGNAFTSYPGTYNIYICARNNAGTVDTPTTASIAFTFFSSGLDSTEAAAVRTAIDTYEASLGRNV